MKRVIGILVVLALAAVIAFFAFRNPLGRLVKLAIENFGPEMTQAEVSVKSVDIATADGQGTLRGLHLGNPRGFATDHALNADTIQIAIEPASITKDVIVLHKVLINSPHIIYEKGANGSNFDAIEHNVETYIGTDAGKGRTQKDGSGNKRMIIDSFIIRNAKINYSGKVELPLPDIELHNVGRSSGGATPGQVARAIIDELNDKLVRALAKAAVISGVGSAAVGAGMALKRLLGK